MSILIKKKLDERLGFRRGLVSRIELFQQFNFHFYHKFSDLGLQSKEELMRIPCTQSEGQITTFHFSSNYMHLKICQYNTSILWAMWSGGKKATCELSLERTRHLEHLCPLHTNLPHVSHITSAQVSVTLSNSFVALEFLCHGLSQFVLKMR